MNTVQEVKQKLLDRSLGRLEGLADVYLVQAQTRVVLAAASVIVIEGGTFIGLWALPWGSGVLSAILLLAWAAASAFRHRVIVAQLVRLLKQRARE